MAKITQTIFIGILIILTWWIINTWVKIPIVCYSRSTGECVKVIIDGVESPCNTLPEKYEKMWVK